MALIYISTKHIFFCYFFPIFFILYLILLELYQEELTHGNIKQALVSENCTFFIHSYVFYRSLECAVIDCLGDTSPKDLELATVHYPDSWFSSSLVRSWLVGEVEIDSKVWLSVTQEMLSKDTDIKLYRFIILKKCE